VAVVHESGRLANQEQKRTRLLSMRTPPSDSLVAIPLSRLNLEQGIVLAIEEGYKEGGVSTKEAESRAWATVNKESGGGKKSGSGRGKKERHASSRNGGKN
jgi:hypothetical protein